MADSGTTDGGQLMTANAGAQGGDATSTRRTLCWSGRSICALISTPPGNGVDPSWRQHVRGTKSLHGRRRRTSRGGHTSQDRLPAWVDIYLWSVSQTPTTRRGACGHSILTTYRREHSDGQIRAGVVLQDPAFVAGVPAPEITKIANAMQQQMSALSWTRYTPCQRSTQAATLSKLTAPHGTRIGVWRLRLPRCRMAISTRMKSWQ